MSDIADSKDRKILKAAMKAISELPPMDIEKFRNASVQALRDASAKAQEKADDQAE